MRRFLLLLAAAALTIGAAMLPPPPAPPEPDFSGEALIDDIAGAEGSVWYCPWLSAGAVRDSYLMLASEPTVQVEVTLPSPIPNEEADRVAFTLSGPAAEPLEVASIVRRGDAPGFVEFNDGPAGVAGVVTSDAALAGDRCTASVPKLWHLPGGTTRPGHTTILRLFNPFPEPAKVSVTGASEFGEVGLIGLTSIDVGGRSWLDVSLNEIVPLLEDLSLTVSSEEGLVIPAIVVATALDEATWPGIGLSAEWEFPVVRQTGLVPTIALANPGDAEAVVEVDVFTGEGSMPSARTVTIPPGRPARIPLDDLADRFFAVRVRASSAVAAVVIAEDDAPLVAEGEAEEEPAGPPSARIAGTAGAAEPARRWLLPGPGGLRTATSTIWVLNSHSEAVTVSVQPLGSEEFAADKLVLEAGTVRRVVLSQETGVAGYLLSAATPISAAWSVESGDGVAFVAGVSIDE